MQVALYLIEVHYMNCPYHKLFRNLMSTVNNIAACTKRQNQILILNNFATLFCQLKWSHPNDIKRDNTCSDQTSVKQVML